ncbi:DUF1236 domain-containing protein [Aestuariivirga sp. YIM B02566]|uniref:DUF1236 domain-containing protein n=1 Tax=Taklimakanibacter albus TaxID=2800327 RepID=A0ACC5R1S0_9HYPH|nr:DUF1236 domain-containing protein [Aestuariivirga sp. YIM B02566]MBK1866421.1 DUF1236 domain-containing protein [Aestuariivirga sp. YIM B02566]
MRTIPAMLIASTLLFGAPLALADDFVIAPEISLKFQDEVKVKKYKSHKYDGDVKVGVVVPGDVEYYDVPDSIVVAEPRFKKHKYVYLNDHVYIVDGDRRVVAVVR